RVGRALEWARAELLDDRVERLRQPRNLAAAHALDAELPDELVDPPRRDASEVGVGDHGHERLLGPPTRLQKPVGEIAPLSELRHRELDRTDARVPAALAVAIALVPPLRRALAVGRTAERVGLRAHQRLGEVLHHRPQQIRTRLLKPLAQPTRKLHRRLDHRVSSRSSWIDVARMARWSATTGP